MIFDPNFPIYLYYDYVDMRKGHNTLSYIVIQKMNLDLLSAIHLLFSFSSPKIARPASQYFLMAMG